jgi:hypothetical protein
MEGFRELHNNTVPKKHDSQNNTPLDITRVVCASVRPSCPSVRPSRPIRFMSVR